VSDAVAVSVAVNLQLAIFPYTNGLDNGLKRQQAQQGQRSKE
jgi:hypothetical protein